MVRVQLLWGCDPARQLEVAWLRQLIGPALLEERAWWRPEDDQPEPVPGLLPVLVESGLLRLERAPAPQRLQALDQQRRARLQTLQSAGGFAVLHLSDEEGVDADSWYAHVPCRIPIWRNFPHPRFEARPQVRCFPIGPRDVFLQHQHQQQVPASQRQAPWAFMGTLWPSGSRRLAVSLFLAHLPAGHYFGGQHFGQGLPLDHYAANLRNSVFALAPEGDRHLDTFRLWESLCCGCIPLVVEHNATADRLLSAPHPLPVFASWPEALHWADCLLQDPIGLDALQDRISRWWQGHQGLLAQTLAHSLIAASC